MDDASRNATPQKVTPRSSVINPDGAASVAFGVAKVPVSYLVDPRGVIVAKLVGGVRDDDLERVFQRLRSSVR